MIDYQIAVKGELGRTTMEVIVYTPIARTSDVGGIRQSFVDTTNYPVPLSLLSIPPYDNTQGYPHTLAVLGFATDAYSRVTAIVRDFRDRLHTALPNLKEDPTIPLASRVWLSVCLGNYDVERTYANYLAGIAPKQEVIDELQAAGIPLSWKEYR